MLTLQQSLIFIMGILLTSGLFYLILFFGFRQRIALLFISLFCFCQTAKAFFRTDARLAIDLLNLTEAQTKLCTGTAYTFGNFFLVVFLLYQFNTPRKKWMMGGIAGLLLLFYLCHWPQLPLVVLIGTGIALYAFPRKKLGSSLIIFGLLTFGMTTYIEINMINKMGYFIGTIVFIATITIFVGYQIREQMRLQRQALLRSSTLENQLLKRSLQPHFLFNSLMSLQEWIETCPEKAAHFVQALAEEFRSICQMSGNQLISIEEELAMCRSHLQIMGFRKHAKFELQTEGITGEEQIPPAIFHTLVENGLTHGYAERDRGRFILTKKQDSEGILYELFNDGNSQTSLEPRPQNGTGLKYVKSRLEESYPGKWELNSNPIESGWLVSIWLKH